jgi:hypothetical protein
MNGKITETGDLHLLAGSESRSDRIEKGFHQVFGISDCKPGGVGYFCG